jgi:hypothetical protein
MGQLISHADSVCHTSAQRTPMVCSYQAHVASLHPSAGWLKCLLLACHAHTCLVTPHGKGASSGSSWQHHRPTVVHCTTTQSEAEPNTQAAAVAIQRVALQTIYPLRPIFPRLAPGLSGCCCCCCCCWLAAAAAAAGAAAPQLFRAAAGAAAACSVAKLRCPLSLFAS